MVSQSPRKIGPVGRAFRVWDRATGWVDFVARWFMGLALLGILGMLVFQVLVRYILPFPVPWVEEVAIYLSGYVALVGMSVCLRASFHLEVTVLVDLLPEQVRLIHVVLLNLLVAAFALYLMKYGMKFVELGAGQTTPSSYLMVSHARMAVPIGGALLLLQSITMMGRAIVALKEHRAGSDIPPAGGQIADV
ncbi:MAG: TRAP transporter small permease [Devosia sp.]